MESNATSDKTRLQRRRGSSSIQRFKKKINKNKQHICSLLKVSYLKPKTIPFEIKVNVTISSTGTGIHTNTWKTHNK